MLYVIIGAVGFLVVGLYDVAQIRGREGVAKALSSIGYLCITASAVLLMVSARLPNATVGHFLVDGVPALVFFLLLIYSVFVEIPLALRRKALVRAHERTVVSVGFYGKVRHPGFIWFTLLWVSIAFLYRDSVVTIVGSILVALDFVLVLMEDIYFFPRIFRGYDEYKKEVPFLIPGTRW